MSMSSHYAAEIQIISEIFPECPHAEIVIWLGIFKGKVERVCNKLASNPPAQRVLGDVSPAGFVGQVQQSQFPDRRNAGFYSII